MICAPSANSQKSPAVPPPRIRIRFMPVALRNARTTEMARSPVEKRESDAGHPKRPHELLPRADRGYGVCAIKSPAAFTVAVASSAAT